LIGVCGDEFRSSGVQEFRSSGVQEFRSGDHAVSRHHFLLTGEDEQQDHKKK
jgi:hypothetical protein